MFSKLKAFGASARANLASEVSKFRNREFMEAVVAACALIAAADGDISSDEKQKMMGFVGMADELKHFGSEKVISYFKEITDKFDFDFSIGQAEAMKVIGRIKGNADQAAMVVRVACVIGASDGDFDAKEQDVARKIATELGLNPAEFDL